MSARQSSGESLKDSCMAHSTGGASPAPAPAASPPAAPTRWPAALRSLARAASRGGGAGGGSGLRRGRAGKRRRRALCWTGGGTRRGASSSGAGAARAARLGRPHHPVSQHQRHGAACRAVPPVRVHRQQRGPQQRDSLERRLRAPHGQPPQHVHHHARSGGVHLAGRVRRAGSRGAAARGSPRRRRASGARRAARRPTPRTRSARALPRRGMGKASAARPCSPHCEKSLDSTATTTRPSRTPTGAPGAGRAPAGARRAATWFATSTVWTCASGAMSASHGDRNECPPRASASTSPAQSRDVGGVRLPREAGTLRGQHQLAPRLDRALVQHAASAATAAANCVHIRAQDRKRRERVTSIVKHRRRPEHGVGLDATLLPRSQDVGRATEGIARRHCRHPRGW